MAGRVDLARLAASLPHTLRIREDSVIESGTVEFELAGQSQAADRHWTARVEASELAARRGGQRFTWNDPLQITLEAHRTAEQWRVERFACNASSLTIALAGTPAAGSFALQCNVEQFVGQLREFIEMGSLEAAGNLTARLDWQRGDDRRVTLSGTGLVENFDLSAGETTRWHEPRLSIALAMQGQEGGQQATRIDSARLQLQSSSDRLDLQLLEPVESPGTGAIWTVGCTVQGQWSSWLVRLRPLLSDIAFLTDGTSTVEGPLDLQLTARITSQSLEIDQGTLRSEPLHVSTPQIRIDEQVVAVQWKGRWEIGTLAAKHSRGNISVGGVGTACDRFSHGTGRQPISHHGGHCLPCRFGTTLFPMATSCQTARLEVGWVGGRAALDRPIGRHDAGPLGNRPGQLGTGSPHHHREHSECHPGCERAALEGRLARTDSETVRSGRVQLQLTDRRTGTTGCGLRQQAQCLRSRQPGTTDRIVHARRTGTGDLRPGQVAATGGTAVEIASEVDGAGYAAIRTARTTVPSIRRAVGHAGTTQHRGDASCRNRPRTICRDKQDCGGNRSTCWGSLWARRPFKPSSRQEQSTWELSRCR